MEPMHAGRVLGKPMPDGDDRWNDDSGREKRDQSDQSPVDVAELLRERQASPLGGGIAISIVRTAIAHDRRS